jgi:hypothetical protein
MKNKNLYHYETMTLDVSLPKAFRADDYHEVDWLDTYLKVMIRGIKVEELDSDKHGTSPYIFIVYIGDRPSEETIKELVDAI